MERILQLMGSSAGLGVFSWVLWPGMSSHDTGLMVLAVLLGLAAGVCAFLAIAKVMHTNKRTAAVFWVAMLGALLYLFPPFGLSPLGWIAWGSMAFLALASLAVIFDQASEGEHSSRRRKMKTYQPLGENGWDEGVNFTGYPTDKALRMGTDKSNTDL